MDPKQRMGSAAAMDDDYFREKGEIPLGKSINLYEVIKLTQRGCVRRRADCLSETGVFDRRGAQKG